MKVELRSVFKDQAHGFVRRNSCNNIDKLHERQN